MLNDIMGNISAQRLADDLGEIIETLKTLGWKEQRPWAEFFQVLKPPGWTYKDIEQRILTNFLQYRSNYVAIMCGVFLLRILFAPILFLSIVLCATITIYVVVVWKTPYMVGEHQLNEKSKIICCGVFSFIFLGLCGALEHLLWGLVISSLLCLLHMIFRPRSVSSKANKIYEEIKISNIDFFGIKKDTYHLPVSNEDIESSINSFGNVNGDGAISSGEAGISSGLTSASMRKRKS
jgi:hypothetical protein